MIFWDAGLYMSLVQFHLTTESETFGRGAESIRVWLMFGGAMFALSGFDFRTKSSNNLLGGQAS